MTNVRSQAGGLAAIALLGGCGGAVNALLCFLKMPVPVHDDPDFSWLVVPGGAVHGAVLAVVPVATALVVARWRARQRVLLAPAVGWFAGYASWIPLHHWVFDFSWSKSLVWPWRVGAALEAAWLPFAYFGAVGAASYVLLATGSVERGAPRAAALLACAGALGSLWWWVEFGPWYFAVLHGTIWGALVGWGISLSGVLRQGGLVESS